MCVYICEPACVCMCVCKCVYMCLYVWSICLFVTVHVITCVCMCIHACVGASLGVAPRGRGLPAHEHMPVAGLGHRYPSEVSLVVCTIHSARHDHTAVFWPAEERRKKGVCWRRVMPSTVWGLCFSTNQRHYYHPHFKDAEIEALRDWVPDSGQSLSNECHRRGSKLWLPNLLKSAWSSPATWLLRYPLRGHHAWGARLPPHLACRFSGKPKPEDALSVGFRHTQDWLHLPVASAVHGAHSWAGSSSLLSLFLNS